MTENQEVSEQDIAQAEFDPAALAARLTDEYAANIVEILNETEPKDAAQVILHLPHQQAIDVLDQPGLEMPTEIVDALRRKPHPTHAHLGDVLDWAADLKPGQTLLTHMDKSMDYRKLCAELPAGVAPAYDNQVIAL